MKTLIHRVTALIALLMTAALMAVTTSAQAQTNSDESWYVGGGLGISNVDKLCSGTRYDCDDDGAALHVFGGLKLNPYFAFEASFDVTGGLRTPGARAAGYDGDVSALFLGINAVGSIPLGSRVSLLGGLSGVFSFASTDVTNDRYRNSGNTTCYYDSYYDDWYSYCTNHRYDRDYETESAVAAGALLGIEVRVAKNVHVRAQAQRYFNVNADLAFNGDRDVDLFTLNAFYAFR
jgi:hypothetical protein